MSILDEILPIPPSRGRRAAQVEMTILRELGEEDVKALTTGPKLGIAQSPLTKLRNSHHMLARLLGEGKSCAECSLLTGYVPSRISILQNDPAFKDLVEYYRTQVDAQYIDVHARLASLGLSTIDELAERLENDPDQFANKDLMALAELTLDRAGHGPTAKTQVNGAITITVQKFTPGDNATLIEGT